MCFLRLREGISQAEADPQALGVPTEAWEESLNDLTVCFLGLREASGISQAEAASKKLQELLNEVELELLLLKVVHHGLQKQQGQAQPLLIQCHLEKSHLLG